MNLTTFYAASLKPGPVYRILPSIILFITSAALHAGDYYWVGGSGNWSDYASHWATTSGGDQHHSTPPTRFDRVFFDSNSFESEGETVYIDIDAECALMDWTGVTGSPILTGSSSSTLSIYGSLTLVQDMDYNYNSVIYFLSSQPGNTITSGGQRFLRDIRFEGSGSYRLEDDLDITGRTIHLNLGGLDLNDAEVVAGRFLSSSATVRSLNLGSSEITLTYSSSHSGNYAMAINGENLTFSGGDSHIRFTGSFPRFINSGLGLTFNTLTSESQTGNTRIMTTAGSRFSTVIVNNQGRLLSPVTADTVIFNSEGHIQGSGIIAGSVTVTGDAYVSGSNCELERLEIGGNGFFTGNNNIYGTVILAEGGRYLFENSTTHTVTELFSAIGSCAAPILFEASSATGQATMSFNGSAVEVSRITMKGIAAEGAGPFIAAESVDLGNNSGWTITPPAPQTLYWVGGEGSWEDASNWSASSGGEGGFCVPTRYDHVVFDNNSFTSAGEIVTIEGDPAGNAYCRSMVWSDVTGEPVLESPTGRNLYIDGSLTLTEGFMFGFRGSIIFTSGEEGNTITTAGQLIQGDLIFDAAGGGYQLTDDLEATGTLFLENGLLDLNGAELTLRRFMSQGTGGTRELIMDDAVVNITYSSSHSGNYGWSVNGTALTLQGTNSTINFTGSFPRFHTSGSSLQFGNVTSQSSSGNFRLTGGESLFDTISVANGQLRIISAGYIEMVVAEADAFFQAAGVGVGEGHISGNATVSAAGGTYHNLVIDGNATLSGADSHFENLVLNGSALFSGTGNSFGTVLFNEGGVFTINSGLTITILDGLTGAGSCARPITVESSASPQATIYKEEGTVIMDRVTLQGIEASGGATFIATNAVDGGNNSGWHEISPPSVQTLYWVGGEGEWEDIDNWSSESGGEGGYCVPTRFDNVVFDHNSFDQEGATVTIAGDASGSAVCYSMDWSGVQNSPVFSGNSTLSLNIYGSLILSENIDFDFAGDLYFMSEDEQSVIVMSGNGITGNIYFNGEGNYRLDDALIVNRNIYLLGGGLNLNGQEVVASRFFSDNSELRSLTMGSSLMTLQYSSSRSSNYALSINGTNLDFDAGSSLIRFTGTWVRVNNSGDPVSYNNMESQSSSGNFRFNSSGTSINSLSVNHSATLSNGLSADSLFLAMGGNIRNSNNSIGYGVIDGSFTISGSDGWYGELMVNSNFTISAGDNHFDTIVLNGDSEINSNNSYGTMMMMPGNRITLRRTTTQIIEQTLIAEGECASPIIIESDHATDRASISKADGAVIVTRVNLEGINATGGALFTANDAIDLGNNEGWIINAPATQNLYWVGGSGNWDDVDNWSLTSGGQGGYCVPTMYDNVFFDENSFPGPDAMVTVSGDASGNAYCLNIDWSGVTNSPVFYAERDVMLNIYGSMTLSEGIDYQFEGDISFLSENQGNTITTAHHVAGRHLYLSGNGEYLLVDDLQITGTLFFGNGRFDLDNNNITANRFLAGSSNNRELNLGDAVITLTYSSSQSSNYAFQLNSDNLVFDAGSSVITFTGSYPRFFQSGPPLIFYRIESASGSGNIRITTSGSEFNTITSNNFGNLLGGNMTAETVILNSGGSVRGDGNTIGYLYFGGNATIANDGYYGDVVIEGNGTISGTNRFNTISFNSGGTYTFPAGRTQLVEETLYTATECGEPVVIRSSSVATAATLEVAEGLVELYRVDIQGIDAAGGAEFTAYNSLDSGGNSGWYFPESSLSLYWVGGSGDWNDIGHWSASSGGEGGYCIPTRLDNVVFDQNSFPESGGAVNLNVSNAECRDMDWSDASNSPSFYSSSAWNNLRIYGSLLLDATVDFSYNGRTYFEGLAPEDTLYLIDMAGNSFGNDIWFNGEGGVWSLQAPLTLSTNDIHFNRGMLVTNGLPVSSRRFISNSSDERHLVIAGSLISLGSTSSQSWYVNGSNFELDADSSEIRLLPATSGFWSTTPDSVNYNLVYFPTMTGESSVRTNHTLQSLVFRPDGTITGGGRYGSAEFRSDGSVSGGSSFDTLVFFGDATIMDDNTFYMLSLASGSDVAVGAGSTQTITDHLQLWGDENNPLRLRSITPGSQATFYKEEGTVSGNYVHISDMSAEGDALFNLYNSDDMGNNSGWNFLQQPELEGSGNVEVCENIAPFELDMVTPAGGSYSGPGAIYDNESGSYMFDPSVAGAGVAPITYSKVLLGLFPDQYSFEIDVKPLPVIDCPTDTTLCAGTPFFAFDEAPGIYLFGSDTVYGFAPESAGEYHFIYRESNDCGTSECHFTITVYETPVISVYGDLWFCEGETTILTATEGQSYIWDNGATGRSIEVAAAGEYSVTVTDINGCTGMATVEVEQRALPVISLPAGIVVWCDSGPVLLDGALPDGGVYSGEAVSYDETEGHYLFTPSCYSPGNHTIVYSYTDEYGCSAVDSFTVTTACNPDIIVTPLFDQPDPVCYGYQGYQLPDISLNGVSGSWTPAFNSDETTQYTFIPDAGSCADTVTMTVSVILTPPPSGDAEQSFGSGNNTLKEIVVEGENIEWYGSYSDAISGSGQLPDTTSLVDGVTYFAVQYADGCRSFEPLAVTVSVATSIDHIRSGSISLYPNPVSSILTVEHQSDIDEVRIYSLTGNLVMSPSGEGRIWQFNVSSLPSGAYLIHIRSGSVVRVMMFIKE